MKNKSLDQQIFNLSAIITKLSKLTSLKEKVEWLSHRADVQDFITKSPFLKLFLSQLDLEAQFILLSIIVLGQGPVVLRGLDDLKDQHMHLTQLANLLRPVEKNYQVLGGIIGYHLTILKLIQEKDKSRKHNSKKISLIKPEGLDISQESPLIKTYIRDGIEALAEMADIYPVGGAGDRLGLVDNETGKPLPAAKLNFCGYTLIEGLFRDLQAREYLYFKLTGKQLITPVALMTSYEKNNDTLILELCEKNNWFGRPKESIRTFTQPLVPVITIEGNWCLSGPLQLKLKPGGHGVIWKLADETGIFDWFQSCNKRKILIRQINNPIAATDYGLLAFIGYGWKHDKIFGFASCPRLLNAPEGMNVVIKEEKKGLHHYCLTNLEYTDFAQKGIQDIPEKPGSSFSALPSNTNILFADIKAIKEVTQTYSIPGLLINMKNKMPYINPEGKISELPAGRLEATMQNIADAIVDSYPAPLEPEEFSKGRSYITFNHRRKTISVTKAQYKQGSELIGTPEGCLFDALNNYRDLFKNYCKFDLPELGPQENYLTEGPPFYIVLHPSIGPLFSIIAQKIRKGKLCKGSELQLEIADIDVYGLHLKGSLRIIGKNIVGNKKGPEPLQLGLQTSKCILKNVRIKNKGIDYLSTSSFWSNQIKRWEETYIYLEENSEFIAENLTFAGAQKIIVPAGQRMIAYEDKNQIKFKLEPISLERLNWHYAFNSENTIVLNQE